MGLDKLIQVIAALVVIAASTGHLPRLDHEVRIAQAHLVQETKASGWGMPMLLKAPKTITNISHYDRIPLNKHSR